uniref:G protein-coupled receptor 87 n=1 Tax=Malurus cyaneus samueli TaxID=2593467 RepID=A0A8C5X817_9PASS
VKPRSLPEPPEEISAHNIVLPVLYLVIFLASLLLNGLAVWIFFHIRNKTSFIFYLKNIVVADLLMTMTFPFRMVRDAQGPGPGPLSALLCRYSSVLFSTNMYTTIVFLGLISVDRYLKVVKPFGDSRMYSIAFTKALSAGVWLLMALLALPGLILASARRGPGECPQPRSPPGLLLRWHWAVLYIHGGTFVAVLAVLIGCYVAISRYIQRSSRQFISASGRKRRHNQSIRVVVAVFFTCFLPYHLCRVPFAFGHLERLLGDSAHRVLYYCKEMTLFLSACNVCLDPIIYFFMCRSFSRRLFRKSNMRTRSESIRSLQSTLLKCPRLY